MNKKLHFFIVPLILTLLTFLIEPRCTQGLCLFPGKGLPLGFYYEGIFRIDAFIIDYIFLFIMYVVPVLWIQDAQQWLAIHNGKGDMVDIEKEKADINQ